MRLKRILGAVAASLVAAGTLTACGGQPVGGGETPSTGQSGEASSTLTGKDQELIATEQFRQALKLAIDMDAIIEGTLDGMAEPANTLMAPGPFKPAGLNEWTYDPERAQELLDEIGWDPNTTLDLVYYYGDQQTVDFMSAVQQYLSVVGIKVAPRKLEGDLGTQLWTAPVDPVEGPSAVDWDIAYAAVAALAPHEYYDRFLSTYPGNSYWPKDEEFEPLIIDTASTSDVEEQIVAFDKVIQWENEHLPAIPLYYQPVFIVESDDLDRAGAGHGNEQYNYDWKIHKWDIPANSSGEKVLRTNGGAVDFFETPFLNPGLHLSNKALFDHLLVANPDLTEFEPGLASAYEVSEDGKTVTLTLRDGVTWHDGEPITPEDVKFTFELASKVPGLHAVTAGTVDRLEGVEEYRDGDTEGIEGITTDGNTVTMNFAEVDPNLLLTLSQLPPLPEHLLKDADPLQIQQDAFFQNPVGSGPYKVKEVRMGDYTILEAFDGYWDGRPLIDTLEMYSSGESDPNLVKNVEAGKVDYAYTKSAEDARAIENVDGVTLVPVDVMYTRLFFVNTFPRG